jgi:hypothetical protein
VSDAVDLNALAIDVLLRHRLPPFLGEKFGGSTGLIDVGIDRHCVTMPSSNMETYAWRVLT